MSDNPVMDETDDYALVAFLNARLDEDEAIANAAAQAAHQWWGFGEPHTDAGEAVTYAVSQDPDGTAVWVDGDGYYAVDASVTGHIARHDPARVLREVAFKRGVVARLAVPDPHETGDDCPECATLRLLAAVYADHPDYRQEWKP